MTDKNKIIENEEIVDFYKGKDINKADKLLFKTAQNNYNEGFKAGKSLAEEEHKKDIERLKLVNKNLNELIEQKAMQMTYPRAFEKGLNIGKGLIQTEQNKKLEKLKESIGLRLRKYFNCDELLNENSGESISKAEEYEEDLIKVKKIVNEEIDKIFSENAEKINSPQMNLSNQRDRGNELVPQPENADGLNKLKTVDNPLPNRFWDGGTADKSQENEKITDKEIAELFADGKMKVKHTWLKAYDSETGREGWISVESILDDIIKEMDKLK